MIFAPVSEDEELVVDIDEVLAEIEREEERSGVLWKPRWIEEARSFDADTFRSEYIGSFGTMSHSGDALNYGIFGREAVLPKNHVLLSGQQTAKTSFAQVKLRVQSHELRLSERHRLLADQINAAMDKRMREILTS